MPSDSLFLRLQLAVGSIATLGEELPALHGRRAFASRGTNGGAPLLVTLHPRPPDGPDPVALAQRIDQLRELAHPLLILPIAQGELEGRAWVIESVPTEPTAAELIDERRLPPVSQGIPVLRDLARALVALHRRNLTHGEIGPNTVRVTPSGAALTGLGLSLGTSQQDDLEKLGGIVWALLAGPPSASGLVRLSSRRRGVPAEFDTLLASLTSADVARRPVRAETILEVLDAFPASRPRRPKTVYIVLILVVAAIVLAVLMSRPF